MALLTELEYGRHAYFKLVGKIKLSENGFSGPRTYDTSSWYGVNESFGVDVGDGNVVYPRVSGGYDLKINKLFRRDKDFKALEIPVADRHKEEWVSRVNQSQFKRASLVRGEDGKVVIEKFISDIDYAEYLKENLVEGTEVVVSGEVSYSLGKDGETVYRNYDVKNIYLNETVVDEDGASKLKNPPEAFIRQTYLVDDSSLSSTYKKDLEKEGETVISLTVPQYLGKILHNGQKITWKRVTPLRQALVYRIDKSLDEEQLAKTIKWPERLFKIKKDTVREIHIIAKINEGHSVETGIANISPALQELIDDGLLSLEDVKNQTTVRGARISELIYLRPHVEKTEDGVAIPYRDDKYSSDVLVAPYFDDSEGEDVETVEDVVESEDDNVTSLDDDEFAAIFNV